MGEEGKKVRITWMMIRWGHEWKSELPEMRKDPVPVYVGGSF